jgi:hypothetical protein
VIKGIAVVAGVGATLVGVSFLSVGIKTAVVVSVGVRFIESVSLTNWIFAFS